VVQALEARRGGVDFDDDLVGHLYDFGTRTNVGTGYALKGQLHRVVPVLKAPATAKSPVVQVRVIDSHATVFHDSTRLHNRHIQSVVLYILEFLSKKLIFPLLISLAISFPT
jgi:hypothetical protein